MSGEGNVTVHVWPAHIGFGSRPDEVLSADLRAQIHWRIDDGEIVGAAKVWVPQGVYDYLLYFHDLGGPPVVAAKFDQPFTAPVADYVVVDPIRNEDPALKALGGITR